MNRPKLNREEAQAKASKARWRQREEDASELLRRAIDGVARAENILSDRETSALRNIANTAGLAKDKAYPEDLHSGLTLHIPARLLQMLQPILSKPVKSLPPVAVLTSVDKPDTGNVTEADDSPM